MCRNATGEFIGAAASEEQATDRLCEMNVIEQASQRLSDHCRHDAWNRGQALAVHSWIYSLRDGLLRDLGFRCGDL
jgi:carbonic anhydrase